MLKELVLRHQYVAFLCNSKNDFLEFVNIATDEMKFLKFFGPSGSMSLSYFGLDDNKTYSDKEIILAQASPTNISYGIGDKSYILIVHGIYEHGQYYINNEDEFTFHSINECHLDVYTGKNYTADNWKIFDSSLIFRKKKLEKISLS